MAFDTFDTQDAIPADRKAGAVELKDGKWAVPKVVAAPDPTLGDAGKRALDAEREARQKAETDLKEAQRKLDDAIKAQQASAANIPKDQLEQWKSERDAAVAAEQAKTKAAEQRLEQIEVEKKFRELAVLPDVRVFMERLDDNTLPIFIKRLGRTTSGSLCVLDADGKPTTDDPKAFILSLKPKYPYLFRGAGSDGSGSDASSDSTSSGAFDPVAAGKAMAAAQKAAGDNAKAALR